MDLFIWKIITWSKPQQNSGWSNVNVETNQNCGMLCCGLWIVVPARRRRGKSEAGESKSSRMFSKSLTFFEAYQVGAMPCSFPKRDGCKIYKMIKGKKQLTVVSNNNFGWRSWFMLFGWRSWIAETSGNPYAMDSCWCSQILYSLKQGVPEKTRKRSEITDAVCMVSKQFVSKKLRAETGDSVQFTWCAEEHLTVPNKSCIPK